MNPRVKGVFLLAVLIFSSVSVTTGGFEELTVTLVSNPYTIEDSDQYHTITMEGFFTRGLPGDPALPQKIYDLELPYDVNLETVDIQMLWKASEEIPGLYEIGPSPLIASGGRTVLYSTIQNGKNVDVYNSNGLYPESPVDILRTHQIREKKYVRVQFTPFQYNPVTKALVINQKVKIRVFWTTKRMPLTAPPGPGIDYVIVTTNAIVSNSTRLNAFKNHLQSQGFTAYTVTETQYGAAGGQQRAVNIRNWLQANWPLLNIKYVLLIGDPDPDDPTVGDSFGDIPMLMCWPNPGSALDQTPTDYFYADLTGNWDSDGDNSYGEFGQDTVDFGPEVYVGRIPVYGGNYATLDSILNKFINYTGANTSIMLPMAISNYQDEHSAANSCLNGWGRTDGLDLPQQVITNITNLAGFTNYVLYERSGFTGRGHDPVPVTAFGYKAPLTNANVINQWPNDYGIVFWWGHGDATGAWRKYWGSAGDDGDNSVEDAFCSGTAQDECVWVPFLSSGDITVDMETFTFQASCENGYPENAGNLQYSLLKKGAVSTVGSTRICWYAIGLWTYWGIIDNAGIGYTYVWFLVFGQSAGEALYNGKSLLANPWGWMGWQNLFDFNLYGDPSMYLEGPILKPPPKGEPPPQVNLTRTICPLANYTIDKAKDLLEEAKELLEEAKNAREDVSDIEPIIVEAEEIIEKARRYCLGNNCIPGNYLGLLAIEMLEDAIERLKGLL